MTISIKKSILSLFDEIITFIKKDFHLKSYLFTFIVIFAGITLNYLFHFYRNYIRISYYTENSVIVMPLFYLGIYFFVAICTLLLRKRYDVLKDYRFYLKSTFFVVLYGVGVGYFGYAKWNLASFMAQERMYILMLFSQFKCFLIFIPTLFLLKFTIDKKVKGLYGLSKNTQHFDGYFALFAFLIPFLIFISFTPDFLSAYPQFKAWNYQGVFGFETWLYTTIYELAYSLDFVMTELIFRGTLVVGMMLIMGRTAILPMVAFYVSIHFGKPLAECISSAFGGYILGALAYQTRHIWGGVMVHISIALTMEIMGLMQFYFFRNQ